MLKRDTRPGPNLQAFKGVLVTNVDLLPSFIFPLFGLEIDSSPPALPMTLKLSQNEGTPHGQFPFLLLCCHIEAVYSGPWRRVGEEYCFTDVAQAVSVA